MILETENDSLSLELTVTKDNLSVIYLSYL